MVRPTNFNKKGYNRPLIGPHQHADNKDSRLSVCTDCRYGIFEGTKYIWTNRGLVHQACEDKRIDEAKIAETALPE